MTQRLVHETKKAREQEVVPIFILEFQAWFIGSYGVQIKNIGNGPAQNFEAELSLEPNGPKETITYQNIASGDTIPVPRPFDETDIVRDTAEEYDILRIDEKCNDIYNNEKPVSDTYVLDQMGEKVRRESYVKEDRPEDHLEDLTDELGDGFEDVEEELHEISSEVKDLNTKLRRLLRY